jgi:hypothetical protein
MRSPRRGEPGADAERRLAAVDERRVAMTSKRSWMRMAVTAAALLAATGAPPLAAQPGQALSKLALEDGLLSWDGVRLGLSLVQSERKLGVTLALAKNPETNPCAKFVTEAERGGLTLTLGFASPKPSAKIAWLKVRFEGEQIASSASDLAAELRARFPGAEWIRPANRPDLAESDDLSPAYSVPGGKEPQAIRFAPREWMELATPNCFG